MPCGLSWLLSHTRQVGHDKFLPWPLVSSFTPPPTPASAAAAKPAPPLPAPPDRPDIGVNRYARRLPIGPAPCPLFAGCAGERGWAGRRRVRHRRDQAAWSNRFPWPPRRRWSAGRRATTRAAWAEANRLYSSLAAVAFCQLPVP